ncbi:hypothetical protein P9112_010610 [Eukaryota sp. TZLM1-RC]
MRQRSNDGSESIFYVSGSLAIVRTCLKSGGFNTVGFCTKGNIILSFNPQGLGSANLPNGEPIFTCKKNGLLVTESNKGKTSTTLYEWSWFNEENNHSFTLTNDFYITINNEFEILLDFQDTSSPQRDTGSQTKISYNLARENTLAGGTYLTKVIGRDLATKSLVFSREKLKESRHYSPLVPSVPPKSERVLSNSDLQEIVIECDDFVKKLPGCFKKGSYSPTKRSEFKRKVQNEVNILEKSLELDQFSLYQSRKQLRAISRSCRSRESKTQITNPLLVPFLSKKPQRKKVESLHWSRFDEVKSSGFCFISIIIDSAEEKDCRKCMVAMEQANFEILERRRDQFPNISLITFTLNSPQCFSVIESMNIIDFPAFLCFANGKPVYAGYNLIGNIIHSSAVLATLKHCQEQVDKGKFLNLDLKFPPSYQKISSLVEELEGLKNQFKNQ